MPTPSYVNELVSFLLLLALVQNIGFGRLWLSSLLSPLFAFALVPDTRVFFIIVAVVRFAPVPDTPAVWCKTLGLGGLAFVFLLSPLFASLSSPTPPPFGAKHWV
jgi:hypothetical protein